MIPEHTLEDRTQIEGRSQVSSLEERLAREPRPVGDDAPAVHRSAQEQSSAARAVIRAARAVLGDRPAEPAPERASVWV